MLISVLALLILLASFWLIVSNLRDVAKDTWDVAVTAASQLSDPNRALSSAAFAALWGLIFWLSFA